MTDENKKKIADLDNIIRQAQIEKNNVIKSTIMDNVEITKLKDGEEITYNNVKFANLNKNQNLREYYHETEHGEDYTLETVKIVKIINFKDYESYLNFSNMLLTDFDFLEGCGGTYTQDSRIKTMSDYNNMTTAERSTVKWYLIGALIQLHGTDKFIVDTQGYNYCRYVGLMD